ncbi:MAG: putative metal-binding motif-containing protein [Myxococcales bacterium]|nr:putative metal-binding motif-containing protein [Myxococcales bacterium]
MWFIASTALAWDLAAPALTTTTLAPASADLVGTPTGGWLAIGSSHGGVEIYEVTTGVLLHTSELGSDLVAWLDGGEALLSCGQGQTWVTPFDGASLGTPASVADAPCSALLPSRRGGVLLVIDDETHRYTSANGLQREGPTLVAARLLAETDDAIALSIPGTQTVRVDDGSVTDTPLLEDLRDLVGDADRFYYAGDRSESISALDGSLAVLVGEVPQLLSADVDGDGRPDLLASTSTTLGVRSTLSSGWWHTYPSPEGFVLATAAPLADSDCASVVYVGSLEYALLEVVGCRGDADGDGYTSEQGDCDDGDVDLHPGIDEICDGLDNDCSQIVDDVPLDLVHPARVDEGSSASVTLSGACPGVALFIEGGTEPLVQCNGYGDSATCIFAQSGTATIRVMQSPEDGSATGFNADHPPQVVYEGSVEVVNVPPILRGDDAYLFLIDREHSVELSYEDPGEDAVTFELLDGPDFLTLSETGRLSGVVPRQRRWDVTVRLVDDDGGVSEGTIVVEGVRSLSSSGCSNDSSGCSSDVDCGCTSVAVVPGWFLILLVGLARRHRTGDATSA